MPFNSRLNLLFAERPKYYGNVANTLCDYHEHEPTIGQPNAFIALEAFGHFVSVPLQQFFFGFDMSGSALMHFRQFISADFGMDDGVLLCLYNGTVNTIYDIIRTVLCRNQSIERRPFPLDGMLQTAVYAVQFFFERINFFQQIAKLD